MKKMLEKTIQFIYEVDKLKSIKRNTLNFHETRVENSAEHSWHLALAVLSFQSIANVKDIDIFKAVKMAILHDIVEIDAGDNLVYNDDPTKFEREFEAAKRIFGILPKELNDHFLELWIEFEKKECPESKFVGALDRFLPLYSNILHGGHSWKEHNIPHQVITEKNKGPVSAGSEILWKKIEELLEDFKQDLHLN